MTAPTRTTSPTGNNRGFTFVEVMVTLVILSGGIVLIYKTFFLCVDYISRLSTRLQASELADEKVADILRWTRAQGDLAFERGPVTIIKNVNRKPVNFLYQVQVAPVAGYDNLFRLKVDFSWMERRQPRHFSRWAMLAL